MSKRTRPNIERLKRRRVVDALVEALGHEDLDIRLDAALALSDLTQAAQVPWDLVIEALVELLQSEDLDVRRRAGIGLNHLGESQDSQDLIVEALERLLRNHDIGVDINSTRILGDLVRSGHFVWTQWITQVKRALLAFELEERQGPNLVTPRMVEELSFVVCKPESFTEDFVEFGRLRIHLPEWWEGVEPLQQVDPTNLTESDAAEYQKNHADPDAETWRAYLKMWVEVGRGSEGLLASTWVGHSLGAGGDHLAAASAHAAAWALAHDPEARDPSFDRVHCAYLAGSAYVSGEEKAYAKAWLDEAATARYNVNEYGVHHATSHYGERARSLCQTLVDEYSGPLDPGPP